MYTATNINCGPFVVDAIKNNEITFINISVFFLSCFNVIKANIPITIYPKIPAFCDKNLYALIPNRSLAKKRIFPVTYAYTATINATQIYNLKNPHKCDIVYSISFLDIEDE